VIFWHTGTTLVVLWFAMRGNPRLDYRVAALGALIPDLVDKPIGRVLFRERYETGHLWGHTLLLNVAFFAVLFAMRGRAKRKLVLLPIGSLLHLAEDGMWSSPRVFWWPLFGTAFPRDPGWRLTWSAVLMEVVGVILLLWLFAAHGMLSRDGLVAFLRTGHLEKT
jgi:hypothetical protein